MRPESRDALEGKVRTAWEAGDLARAATGLIRGYGPEILGFVAALLGNEDDAAEAFAQFSEDLWRGLPGFRWNCSARTYAYVLARNACARLKSSPHAQRQAPLSRDSRALRIQAEVRSSTRAYLRTETKSRVAQLRQRLPEEDQVLLVLRVDKGLEWSEIARVLSDEGDPNAAEVSRGAARLRQRFKSVKDRLRTLAREAGIIPGEGHD